MTRNPTRLQCDPAPTDEEAAALVAALAAYLAERRAAPVPSGAPARRWALAGRLASGSRPWGVGRVPWRVEHRR